MQSLRKAKPASSTTSAEPPVVVSEGSSSSVAASASASSSSGALPLSAPVVDPGDAEFTRNAALLDDPGERDRAVVKLNELMLDERHYARAAADPALFAKMYHRVKQPDRAAVTAAAPDIAAKGQEIHSTADQLHYILARTGKKGGLADQPQWRQPIGTERTSHMTAQTARSVQLDAVAKLIGLYAGDEVRMPAYSHRTGPMLESARDGVRGPAEIARTSASNLNAILGSADPGGANLRVTEADRGPGAYISTDSDNFYGPHGMTLDPRDVHQLPLSTSADNSYEVSSERSKDQRHQFRATGKPVMLTKDGRPAYSSVFVGSGPGQTEELNRHLAPGGFTPGVLGNEKHQLLREALEHHVLRKRQSDKAAGRPPITAPERPPAITAPLTERPVSNEHAYMMQSMVQELNGIYEPHHWTTQWKAHEAPLRAMQDRIARATASRAPKASDADDNPVSDSEWD